MEISLRDRPKLDFALLKDRIHFFFPEIHPHVVRFLGMVHYYRINQEEPYLRLVTNGNNLILNITISDRYNLNTYW